VSFERNASGRDNRGTWSRKEEEYMADFDLVARRHLDKAHYRVFRYHFLLGASWKVCCERLRLDRGNFYHAIYRVERQLGKAYIETQPYALYPPRDYFVMRLNKPVEVTRKEPQSAGPTGRPRIWVERLAG